ncbi:transposase [Micromonospora globbae]|nr:transposase [Micromonospora globbae]
MTKLRGQDLPDWLGKAEASTAPAIRSFARGLRQDLAAVTAGLSMSWNSGPVEGHVNRVKRLKRQMYSRASFDRLRHRILHA